jgi:hypothetical protein
MEQLFYRLSKSRFRSRFRLGEKERDYLRDKGFSLIERHAREFVKKRLAPAVPHNDGRQTPMRNHPVFIAQHATATCCRKCLARWHDIKMGGELTEKQCDYIVSVIMHWLRTQVR